MEIILGNKSYHIPEGWVSRWDLLSNYREDVGSNTIEIPSSAQIAKSEMKNWIRLNEKMDAWSSDEVVTEKLKLNVLYRAVRYFLPASGFYLMLCDFSSFPQPDRIRFLRELGRWRRSMYDDTVGHLYSRLNASDTYSQLRRVERMGNVRDIEEVLLELIRLAEKIPIDFLYGLIAVSEDDWRGTPWNDAYDGCLLLMEEWESACVNLITYYNNNRDKLSGSNHYKTIQFACLRPVSMNPSNMIRLFADKELVSIKQGANPSTLSTNGDILTNVKRYAEGTIVPELFTYQLEIGPYVKKQSAPIITISEDDLSVGMSEALHHIDTDKINLRADIPDTPAYLKRIWDYVEKHGSWKVWDILFDEVGRLDSDDVLVREDSLTPVFDMMVLLHMEELTTTRDDNKPLIVNIATTLGTRALQAIATCLLDAVEKESLVDYVRTTPLYDGEEFDVELVEERQEDLMRFCEQIVTYLEKQEGTTDFITWPVLVIDEDYWQENI